LNASLLNCSGGGFEKFLVNLAPFVGVHLVGSLFQKPEAAIFSYFVEDCVRN